ncbi:hypothetical protein ANCCAN_06433, partial [Ancylostoma caninum]
TASCNRNSRRITRVSTVPAKPVEVKRTVAGKPTLVASRSDDGSIDRNSVQSKATPSKTTLSSGVSPFLREEAKTQGESDPTQSQQADVSTEKWLPYPEVKEMSKSAKLRRAMELEQEKRAKIAIGFYQPRSDVDDTLDQVQSLEVERSEKPRFKWLSSLQSSLTKRVK